MNEEVKKIEEIKENLKYHEVEKESLLSKGKNFIGRNKKKILGVGLTVVGGAVCYALGAKKSSTSDNIIDSDEFDDHSEEEIN